MTNINNQIHLKGKYQREEGVAAVATKPGMVVEETSATTQTYQPQSTAKAVAEKLVAVEDALQGNTLADTYAIGDLVSVNAYTSGCRCQIFLKAGENVAKEAFLEDSVIAAGNYPHLLRWGKNNLSRVIEFSLPCGDFLSQTRAGIVPYEAVHPYYFPALVLCPCRPDYCSGFFSAFNLNYVSACKAQSRLCLPVQGDYIPAYVRWIRIFNF